jgi:hypothetical protein
MAMGEIPLVVKGDELGQRTGQWLLVGEHQLVS